MYFFIFFCSEIFLFIMEYFLVQRWGKWQIYGYFLNTFFLDVVWYLGKVDEKQFIIMYQDLLNLRLKIFLVVFFCYQMLYSCIVNCCQSLKEKKREGC